MDQLASQSEIDFLSGRTQRPSGVTSETLDGLAEKFSDARLERVVLEDGRRFIVKHLVADWLTRASGAEGRALVLWSSGTLDAVAGAVDHTIVACVRTNDGWCVVMRDASEALIPPRAPVSRATVVTLLRGLARLHDVEVEPVAGLCSVGARYALFAPQFHRADSGPGPHPMREVIVHGWELFFDMAPGDVGEAVAAVHADADPLDRALMRFPSTILHGDAKLENMGLSDDRLVLIDWGDLTGFGPVEVDVAWFALRGAVRMEVGIEDVFSAYAGESGRGLDPAALDLACLGSLAQMGFRMANAAVNGRPEPRAVGRSQLDWWTSRVRRALDSLPL